MDKLDGGDLVEGLQRHLKVRRLRRRRDRRRRKRVIVATAGPGGRFQGLIP